MNIKIYAIKHVKKYLNIYMEVQIMKYIIIMIKQNVQMKYPTVITLMIQIKKQLINVILNVKHVIKKAI